MTIDERSEAGAEPAGDRMAGDEPAGVQVAGAAAAGDQRAEGESPSPEGGATQRPGLAALAQLPVPEQLAHQLGGWRGMVESAIPITVFIVVNLVWSLWPALIAAVVLAVAIAGVRLAQRRPVRYAVNGLIGIGVGALLAARSGEARDFYLPGILISYGYAAAMVVSVLLRHPLVGWLWAILFAGGKPQWRGDRRLLRTFTWLTLLWAAVWMVKVSVQAGLYLAHQEHLLGVARLVLGTPPYALLLLFTIWVVRRVQQRSVPVSP